MIKKNLVETISNKFDIPLEGIASVPTAQIIGNTLASIDGCTGIKKYEANEIIIRTKGYLIKILGDSLSMLTFSGGRVSIRGNISTYCIECINL